MKLIQHSLLIVLSCGLLFGGCNSESQQQAKQKEVIFGKIELSDGWARPGSQGQTSGVYLTISNGTASTDTLQKITCDVADKVELHESIQNEDGTMSMRPAETQIIKDGSKLLLEPGGLHIMLMNLNQDLAVGDSLSVSLDFARVGTKTIRVPVKIQQ